MARAISDEELQLKRRARRRLIGAIVLVAAIIVVLPMILDSEPKSTNQSVAVQIPSPEAGVFKSKVVPLPATPDAKAVPKSPALPAEEARKEPAATVAEIGKEAPKETPKEAPKAASKETIKEVPKETPKEAPKETPKEAPKPALKSETDLPKAPVVKEAAKEAAKPAKKEKPKAADGKFVVQVIALADAGRAKEMQAKISAAGIKSYTETVKTAKGNVTRVRAGPFATRQQAEKARDQLKAIGMSGNIATK
jgi:DedD protein